MNSFQSFGAKFGSTDHLFYLVIWSKKRHKHCSVQSVFSQKFSSSLFHHEPPKNGSIYKRGFWRAQLRSFTPYHRQNTVDFPKNTVVVISSALFNVSLSNHHVICLHCWCCQSHSDCCKNLTNHKAFLNDWSSCVLPCDSLSQIEVMQHVLRFVDFLRRNILGALLRRQWLSQKITMIYLCFFFQFLLMGPWFVVLWSQTCVMVLGLFHVFKVLHEIANCEI